MALKRELIYIDGKDETDRVVSYSYQGSKCVIVFTNSNTEYSYGRNRAKIIKTAITEDKAYNIFNYLKKIAEVVGLKTEEGDNILTNSYSKISFIPDDCTLSNYLNGTITRENNNIQPIEVFPFSFNLSQKDAVNKAFSCPLSVIEGPPGTGKTQTILNIIATAIMNGQSVAVVSSNNSATKNVYEKLEKNGIEFIAALLGNSQNKKEFIDIQTSIPDLSKFSLSDAAKTLLKASIKNLFNKLTENLAKKNELALLKQERKNIETEYKHFQNKHKGKSESSILFNSDITSDRLLALWLTLEKQAQKYNKIYFENDFIYRFINGLIFKIIQRLTFQIKYKITDKSFYRLSFDEKIYICQSKFYPIKIAELIEREETLQNTLSRFSFESKKNEYTNFSMQLFKAELCKKYNRQKRGTYTVEELRSKSSEFINDYPIIMSTTYSLRRSLADHVTYDFVIIDESSQVDLATGALALSCAKRAVIVGDLKQLPNVVDAATQQKTDAVFAAFNLSEPYRYSNHSLLSSVIEIFPNVQKTLLREHYRCHPKIIEFCNQKFYDNQLIILTESNNTREPLILYKTIAGNHAREKMNQRQIDIITQEIIPKEQLEDVDLGIVTPYRNQANALQRAFSKTQIKADTVDKFQGRENAVIILSTVDNEISEFTDNPNRLNVAVSRAIEQLILVVNGSDNEKDSNITDLIRYIEYNNFSVIQSDLSSVFDFLYKGYEAKRAEILGRKGKISEYDSENLMRALILDVLKHDKFSKYELFHNYPLKYVIKDFLKLDEQENKYVINRAHLDFLIYNKLGKNPVVAIEVDGYNYHKEGTQQEKRDRIKDKILEKIGLPLLRFETNGSGEKEKLIKKLREIQMLNKG